MTPEQKKAQLAINKVVLRQIEQQITSLAQQRAQVVGLIEVLGKEEPSDGEVTVKEASRAD